MSDDMDRAQAREEEMRADALGELARRAEGRPLVASAKVCQECGEAIPAGRQIAVPGVQLCIECQKDEERWNQ